MNQFSSQKILRHLQRVVEWQQTGQSRPITYELDMTNLCNSKCSFCFGFLQRETDTSSISLPEARSIIGQIQAFGGKGVTFTGGGEPLCNPDTIEAVRYAKSLGLDVGFITNGILLDRKKAEILVDCCTWIRISLDAGTKEVYRETHGLDGDTYERVVENTRVLVESKKNRGSSATIGTGFITYASIIEDMLPYVRVSRDLGVDYAQFRPLLKKFGQSEVNEEKDPAVLEKIEDCRKLATGEFKVLYSSHKYESLRSDSSRRSYARCYGHHFATVVAANKKMYLCCHMRGLDKYCIGDLTTQSLAVIWKSEQRKKVFESVDFKDCPLLCRCDGFNNLLWTISRPMGHESFL